MGRRGRTRLGLRPLGNPDSWDAHADSLLTSVLDQLPEGLTDAEFGYDLRNTRLAALGEERGWHSIGTNHVYVADDAAAVTWPRNVPRIREVTADDLADLTTLHGLEFPGTYATARQLIEDPGKITIVAEDAAGQPIGYASGHIEPDGEGYVDFMAVCPDARGLGDGRRLLAAVCQEVLQRSRVRRVNLTVDTRRRPAIQLYEAFGFSRVASIGGHRSVKPPAHAGLAHGVGLLLFCVGRRRGGTSPPTGQGWGHEQRGSVSRGVPSRGRNWPGSPGPAGDLRGRRLHPRALPRLLADAGYVVHAPALYDRLPTTPVFDEAAEATTSCKGVNASMELPWEPHSPTLLPLWTPSARPPR